MASFWTDKQTERQTEKRERYTREKVVKKVRDSSLGVGGGGIFKIESKEFKGGGNLIEGESYEVQVNKT